MSKIEWTEKTWNPVVGCTPVSPGCLNCYAATMARRLEGMGRPEYAVREVPPAVDAPHDFGRTVRTVRIAEVKNGRAVFTGDVRTVPSRLTDPLKWRKPVRVFVNSMSDLFHEAVPFEFVDRVFAVMALCPHHTFQVLTKRPERMAEYFRSGDIGPNATTLEHRWLREAYKIATDSGERSGARSVYAGLHAAKHRDGHLFKPLPNVWLGTSVERQKEADERIPHLLRCPAAVRFLSCEPLLEAIDLPQASGCGSRHEFDAVEMRRIGWVIVGGESGPHARPCDVAWIRSIVEQCRAAGVPVFMKQLGYRPYHVEDGEKLAIMLDSKKGGDPEEWEGYPSMAGLNVREWPKVGAPRTPTPLPPPSGRGSRKKKSPSRGTFSGGTLSGGAEPPPATIVHPAGVPEGTA